MRPILIGVLLVCIAPACGVDLVRERELGPASGSGPIDLEALVPSEGRSTPDGFRLGGAAGGAPHLALQLRGRAEARLRMHDLGHRDGAGTCYAVHGAEGAARSEEFGVFRFALDGSRLAVPVQDGQTWRVVLAVRDGALYREVARTRESWSFVDWPTLHPDGERVAFWALGGAIAAGSAAVVAARSGEALEVAEVHGAGLPKLWPTWSVRGKLLIRALADETGDDERILHAGVSSRAYRRTGTPRFGPHGTHWAVAVHRDRRAFLLVDGIEVGPFDAVSAPHFVSEHEVGIVVRVGARIVWRVLRLSA